jgi:hypothetical protein
MNIFEALRESHDLQRSYCRRLLASRKGPGREALFLQLKVELKAHAAAEERHLYVPLLMTDGGLDSSRHALKEHHEIEELCDDLSVADKDTAAWLAKAKELAHEVRHHLKEEERKFFQVAGKQIAEGKKVPLGGKYLRELVRMRRKYADEYRTVAVDDAGELKGKGRGAGVAPAGRSAGRPAGALMT